MSYSVHFVYTVNDEGSDIFEEEKDGPETSSDDIQAGNYGWPGAAQLLEVFSAVEKAAECQNLVDADLTCAVSAVPSDDGDGEVIEEDPYVWSLKRVEDGLQFQTLSGITHVLSGDWPSHGVIKDGQLT